MEDFGREIEDSVKTITLFGGEEKLIKHRIESIWKGKISADQIKKISRLSYSGWGRLSLEFLTGIEAANPETGEIMTIMDMLWDTNENLMQILSSQYGYMKRVNEINAEENVGISAFSYESLVEDLYCSPKVKRGIWRTLLIVKEIEKVMGEPPKKIFMEVAREEGVKERTKSRKQALEEKYKSCKKEAAELAQNLKDTEEGKFRQDKLYLYYTQMGKCMYSGEDISLEELQTNKYDIDHIYPRSLTKDDSLKNRVLVKKELNGSKTDRYPVPDSYRTSVVKALWERLLKLDLIEKEKYKRLTRITPLTDDEKSGFINRQLVETSQSVKAASQAIEKIIPDTNLVYVKAGHVSDFRHENAFVKVREINDYHHAKDAYLNIVVGNVFDTKFTRNPRNFVEQKKPYNLKRMFDYDVERGNTVAWKVGESINTVKKVMGTNRILFTRYAYEKTGELFKLNPLKKGNGQHPLKEGDVRADIEKYGGYNSVTKSYFCAIAYYDNKGKRVVSLESILLPMARRLEENPELLLEHIEKTYKNNGKNYKQFKMIESKIKINALLYVDGFPMHLSGGQNDSLLYKPAAQLVLNEEEANYIKKIKKIVDNADRAEAYIDYVLEQAEIQRHKNLNLYNRLMEKHSNKIYSLRPGNQNKILADGQNIFEELNLVNQCKAIMKLLELFSCRPGGVDLTLVGGKPRAAITLTNKTFKEGKSLILVNQSITGIYENRKDLLK